MTVWISEVKALTIAEARATLGSIARDVLLSKKPVIVRTSDGLIQITPFERSRERSAQRGRSLHLLPRELELHNTFGDSL
jgi:hypothetical protein